MRHYGDIPIAAGARRAGGRLMWAVP